MVVTANKKYSMFVAFMIISLPYSEQYDLRICPYNDNFLTNYYLNYQNMPSYVAIDLIIPNNISILPKSFYNIEYNTRFLMTGISYYKSEPYYLHPTPDMQVHSLIYINSLGMIDADYNRNLSSLVFNTNNVTVNLLAGQKIMQIRPHYKDSHIVHVKVICRFVTDY